MKADVDDSQKEKKKILKREESYALHKIFLAQIGELIYVITNTGEDC